MQQPEPVFKDCSSERANLVASDGIIAEGSVLRASEGSTHCRSFGMTRQGPAVPIRLTLPSSSSRLAPPPVLMWLIFSARPAFSTAATLSPPPMIVIVPCPGRQVNCYSLLLTAHTAQCWTILAQQGECTTHMRRA